MWDVFLIMMIKKGDVSGLVVSGWAILFVLLIQTAFAADRPSVGLPSVGLVLGGGGARGAAHIGVLEVLERERIPVACIVGTSMGALVGGAYAAGLSPKQMRSRLSEADWRDIFLDTSDFSDLSFRKKSVTKRYLPGTEIGVSRNGFQAQPGVIAGTKIKLFFNRLVDAHLGERYIEDLPIPLAIVATDIGSGQPVVLGSGSLTNAMRASMSVPGLIDPVDVEGKKLVDGGLVDNLPVAAVKQLCQPDVIIAIDVGSPLLNAGDIGSFITVSAQMIAILTQQNVDASLKLLTAKDLLIKPDLNGITATDFVRYNEAADRGKAVAENHLSFLQQFSATPKLYHSWLNNKKDRRAKKVIVDEIEITPLKKIHPEFLRRAISQPTGQLLKRKTLEKELIRLYGDGFYSYLDYRILKKEDNEIKKEKTVLAILAKDKDTSSDYVTFGFTIDSEYQSNSGFNFRGAYRNTWMNRLGGEFFSAVDVGKKPAVEIDFYQPLNYPQTFFFEPRYYALREDITLYEKNKRIAEYEVDTSYSEFALGYNLGAYGQTKVGWRERRLRAEPDVAAEDFPNLDERDRGLIFSLNLDRRNRLFFPSRGWRADLSFTDVENADYKKVEIDLSGAYPWHDYVLNLRTAYIQSINDKLPIHDAARLGGFLNLSAYATNQILGDDTVYGGLRAERIIGRMPLGLNGDLRLGFGIEAAKVNNSYTMPNDDDWLNSGVIYLGGETPLGPLFLGYGFTTGSNFNLYFRLGAF
jgi:NTE family protein